MVVELLRPQKPRSTSAEEALSRLSYATAPRPVKSNIHPPNPRIVRRVEPVEPVSALQLATELSAAEQIDNALLAKLADLTAVQLPQGAASERLKLFFTLSQLLSNPTCKVDTAKRITAMMLLHVRPLFRAIAPTLRWTTLASLATILDQPCFSRTLRKLGVGHLCALLPEALEDAAAHDKAAVYSILHEMRERRYISAANTNRMLANLSQYLRAAMRDTNIGLRRQLLELHIGLLESRTLTSSLMIQLIQSAIRENAESVAESLEPLARLYFERSVRRALT